MFSLEDRQMNAREDATWVADTIETQRRKIAKLEAVLQELDDYFDDEVDVIDGESGPLPNEAMHWQQRIREALGRSR